MNIWNDTLDRLMHRIKGALADEQRDLNDRRVKSRGIGKGDELEKLRQGMSCGIDSAIVIIEREFKKARMQHKTTTGADTPKKEAP